MMPQSGGLYVVNLDSLAHDILPVNAHRPVVTRTTQETPPIPFPHIALCQAMCFYDFPSLQSLSCLQMSDMGLFLTWQRADSLFPPPETEEGEHSPSVNTHASPEYDEEWPLLGQVPG